MGFDIGIIILVSITSVLGIYSSFNINEEKIIRKAEVKDNGRYIKAIKKFMLHNGLLGIFL